MLSGKVPFPGESNKEIIENVLKGEYHFNHEPFKLVSGEAKDLISKLLVKDVNRRYSAEQAYNHPWVQNVTDALQSEIAADAFENMKNFIDAANFKKASLMYLAFKMPEKDIEELRKLFIQIDVSGDGRINTEEFKKALSTYGLKSSAEEVRELMNKLDANNNGYIDYTEFIAGCMKSKIYLKEEHLKEAFSFFDKDSSGTITKEELKQILSSEDFKIPDDEIDKMIK